MTDYPPGTVLFQPEGQLTINTAPDVTPILRAHEAIATAYAEGSTRVTVALSLAFDDPTSEQVALILALRDLFLKIRATRGPRRQPTVRMV